MVQETASPPSRLGFRFNQTTALLAAFLASDNINTIANTLAVVGISAIGMTLVLITGALIFRWGRWRR